jgi:hypothetical protein
MHEITDFYGVKALGAQPPTPGSVTDGVSHLFAFGTGVHAVLRFSD